MCHVHLLDYSASGDFKAQYKQIGNIVNKTVFKNPDWQETDQLAI